MNQIDTLLKSGLQTLMGVGGVSFSTESGTLVGIVQIEPVFTEPGTEMARQKTPVYATVSCLAGSVANPRAIATMTNSETGKVYRVLEFKENADPTQWDFLCEVQRT